MNEEFFFELGAVIMGLDLNKKDQLISIYGNPLINKELSKKVNEIIVLEEFNPLACSTNYLAENSIMVEGGTKQLYDLLRIGKISKTNKVYVGKEIKQEELFNFGKIMNFINIGSKIYFTKKPQIHTSSFGLTYQEDLMKKARVKNPDQEHYIFEKIKEGKFQ